MYSKVEKEKGMVGEEVSRGKRCGDRREERRIERKQEKERRKKGSNRVRFRFRLLK